MQNRQAQAGREQQQTSAYYNSHGKPEFAVNTCPGQRMDHDDGDSKSSTTVVKVTARVQSIWLQDQFVLALMAGMVVHTRSVSVLTNQCTALAVCGHSLLHN
jgi:hypothetical protein